MGRPKFFRDDSLVIAFRLDKSSANKLRKIANAEDDDNNLSFILRRLVHQFLFSHENQSSSVNSKKSTSSFRR